MGVLVLVGPSRVMCSSVSNTFSIWLVVEADSVVGVVTLLVVAAAAVVTGVIAVVTGVVAFVGVIVLVYCIVYSAT